jgi:hypothetical protein
MEAGLGGRGQEAGVRRQGSGDRKQGDETLLQKREVEL